MSLPSLPVVIRSYIANDKPRLDRHLRFYAEKPTVEAAIRDAALALDERGKRHRHQHRLKRQALLAAQSNLLAAASVLSAVSNFDALYDVVDAATSRIDGLGDLYVYDTALRIGARLGLEPEAVYIQAGVRKGARRLGVETRDRKVPLSLFPSLLASLSPKYVEALLCIYKDRLF